jgi:hypothetical protein
MLHPDNVWMRQLFQNGELTILELLVLFQLFDGDDDAAAFES